jgi:hypothetical protein
VSAQTGRAHRKDRTLARLARYRHVAAHHARELAGDGEVEPGAAEALRGREVGLAELLEQLRLPLWRHADPGSATDSSTPVAAVADPARPLLDLALFGELAGIAQQVEQDPPQPHRIDGEAPRSSWNSTAK